METRKRVKRSVKEIRQQRHEIIQQCNTIQKFVNRRSDLRDMIKRDEKKEENVPESESTSDSRNKETNSLFTALFQESDNEEQASDSDSPVLDDSDVRIETGMAIVFSKHDVGVLEETIKSIYKNMTRVERRLHSIENELLDVIQKHVNSHTHEKPYVRTAMKNDNWRSTVNREVIETFNDTSNPKYRVPDGSEDLAKIDLDIGRGPDRTIRGTAIFSMMNI